MEDKGLSREDSFQHSEAFIVQLDHLISSREIYVTLEVKNMDAFFEKMERLKNFGEKMEFIRYQFSGKKNHVEENIFFIFSFIPNL